MSEDELEEEFIPLTLNKTIENLITSIENKIPFLQNNLEQFTGVFDREFPFESNPEIRGMAEALTWALMDVPLLLFALGLNGSAIIELHSILERFGLREIINHLVAPSKKVFARRIFGRRSLQDFSLIFYDLDIFNKKDIEFVYELNAIRNGVAHKNEKIISNRLFSGKTISFLDIDSVMNEIDCIPYIIKSIHLLIKMSMFSNK